MRVLAVTPWFPSAQLPGSGIFNLRDVELLAQQHEVTVLHLIHPANASSADPTECGSEAGSIRVLRQPFSTTSPGTVIKAKNVIKTHLRGVDLVHTMAMPALLPTRLARPTTPWVHTEHYSQLVTPPASIRAGLSLKMFSRLFASPTETIAVGSALAEVIDRHRSTPSTVIGNEVMSPVEEIPKDRDLTQSVNLIGVGGIIARKGPVEAVETVAELVERGVDAHLVWVGEGELREGMLDRAAALGIRERIRLTGQLAPADLSRELLNSDLFLLPVETETFGVAIAEAMTHGLPVVVTGTGGHEEFLVQAASRHVPERAAGPLADAVQELLSDQECWSRAQIADYAEGRFASSQRRLQYDEVYARAISRAGEKQH